MSAFQVFGKAKRKSTLPGEYCRKAETQKNWLLERPMVEPWGLIEHNVENLTNICIEKKHTVFFEKQKKTSYAENIFFLSSKKKVVLKASEGKRSRPEQVEGERISPLEDRTRDCGKSLGWLGSRSERLIKLAYIWFLAKCISVQLWMIFFLNLGEFMRMGGSKLLRSRENNKFQKRFFKRKTLGAKVLSQKGKNPQSTKRSQNNCPVETKVFFQKRSSDRLGSSHSGMKA